MDYRLHRALGTTRILSVFVFCVGICAPLWAQPSENDLPGVSFTQESPIEQNASHIRLDWEPVEEPEESLWFELQQAESADFEDPLQRYEGPDRASFLAGLAEGEYFFRVRAVSPEQEGRGSWSETLEVVVEYQSLTLAFTLFGIGAVVFLATLTLIVAGSISARREEANEDASQATTR